MKAKQNILLFILIVILILLTSHNVNSTKNTFGNQPNIEANNTPKLEQKISLYDYFYYPLIETYRDIRLTNYYPNDNCNSGIKTASTLSTSDFQVNKYGWYTYNGMLVVASATNYYKKHIDLPYNYVRHDLYDVITININGIIYKAIILDVCGASYWSEDYQRYDLFVTNKQSGIDTMATIVSEVEFDFDKNMCYNNMCRGRT